MSSRKLMMGGLLVALVVPEASAQVTYRDEPQPYMRDGQPAVQTPPPPAADPREAIRNRFRTVYTRAKSPRVVIFWNREFTDEVGTDYDAVATNHSEVSRYRNTVTADSETRVGIKRNTDNRTNSNMSAGSDFDVESSFQAALMREGVNLIDRTSIMRTGGAAKGVGATGNIQQLETEELLSRADIIVEVTQFPGIPGDDKIFRIVARDLRKAKVLASFRTAATPPRAPSRYVAGSRGFVLSTDTSRPSADAMGDQAAVDLMAQLSASL